MCELCELRFMRCAELAAMLGPSTAQHRAGQQNGTWPPSELDRQAGSPVGLLLAVCTFGACLCLTS
eukprot:111359-Pelagomonas_calceolata.AAC.1